MLTLLQDEQIEVEIAKRPLSVSMSVAGASRQARFREQPEQSYYVPIAAETDTVELSGAPRYNKSADNHDDSPIQIVVQCPTFNEQALVIEAPGITDRLRTQGPVQTPYLPETTSRPGLTDKSTSHEEQHMPWTNNSLITANLDESQELKFQPGSQYSAAVLPRHTKVIRISNNDNLDELRSWINGHLVCVSYSQDRHKVRFTSRIGRGQYLVPTILVFPD